MNRDPMQMESPRPIQVIHVDDDPALTDLTATYRKRGNDRFAVETATSASDGLDVLAADEFDCVVSDHDMHGMNGIEFLETVRETYPDLPFILYSEKGSEAVASDPISAGVTDYLQKEGGTDQYELLANGIERGRTIPGRTAGSHNPTAAARTERNHR